MLESFWSVGLKACSCMSVINHSVRAVYTTGIEHAQNMKEIGMKEKVSAKEYKCSDYFNFQKYSYCDLEAEVVSNYFQAEVVSKRMPQPSNKKPDEEKKAKP